jgi:chromosome segregation ATPase
MRLHIKCCPECRFPFEFEAPIHTGMVKLIRRIEKLQARGNAELQAKIEQQRAEIETARVKNEHQNVTNHHLARDIVNLRKELAAAQQKLNETAEQLVQSRYEAEYQARRESATYAHDITAKYFRNGIKSKYYIDDADIIRYKYMNY